MLFLNPPSFRGFDGGAESRYQAQREIRSFWYPTWLACAAAVAPGSRLLDAPPADLSLEQVAKETQGYDMVLIHTSTATVTWSCNARANLSGRTLRLLKENGLRLLTVGLRGEALIRIAISQKKGYQATAIDRLFARDGNKGVYGRLRDVVKGPDGSLYVLTSNRDGRGSAGKSDDRIIRITPGK